MFFGFLEVKYLFFAKEQEIKSMKNPVWIKLFDKIDHLEKKIDELERKDD
jgi:hypothetical protein